MYKNLIQEVILSRPKFGSPTPTPFAHSTPSVYFRLYPCVANEVKNRNAFEQRYCGLGGGGGGGWGG